MSQVLNNEATTAVERNIITAECALSSFIGFISTIDDDEHTGVATIS